MVLSEVTAIMSGGELKMKSHLCVFCNPPGDRDKCRAEALGLATLGLALVLMVVLDAGGTTHLKKGNSKICPKERRK